MKIEKNISLKSFNTFKVGGNADYFCKVSSVDELKEALKFAKNNSLSIFVLGDGSNILVSDDGFRGLVIKIEIKGISFEDSNVILGAGEIWDNAVKSAVEKKLYGIENMSFIPGTVGAGIAGNIGAYGSEIKDVIENVEVFDTNSFKTFTLKRDECKFDYRDSVFKRNKNYIVTKVYLKLSRNGKPNLSYKDIEEYFGVKTPVISFPRSPQPM